MPAARFPVWNAIRLNKLFGPCCNYLNPSLSLRDAFQLTHASNVFQPRRNHRPRFEHPAKSSSRKDFAGGSRHGWRMVLPTASR
jgi:hypothetical protein